MSYSLSLLPFRRALCCTMVLGCFTYLMSSCNSSKGLVYTPLSAVEENFNIDGDIANHQNLKNSSISGLQYEIQSNAQYLYIGVKVTNKAIQDNILRYGMGVWVDTTGKQKNYMGISYPLALTEGLEQALSRQGQSQTLEEAYMELANEFEMVGFAPEPLKATNLSSQHFKAAVGFDEVGNMICEYQLPWRAIFQNRDLNATEKLTIKLQVNDKAIIDSEQEVGASEHNPLGNTITQGQNMNPNAVRSPYGNPMGGMRQTAPMHTAKTPNYVSLIKYEINFAQ